MIAPQSLVEAMAAHGLTPPEHIEPGRIQRFAGAGKRNGNKAGWLQVFDDCEGAAYGDWSTGLSETWQAKKPQNEADQKRWLEQVKKARDKAETERAQKHEKAAKTAADRWAQAGPADGLHGYLIAKGVQAHGLRQDGNELLIPLRDEAGEIRSIQSIDGSGKKQFLYGGQIKGNHYLIGEPDDVLVIAEGYATGATIHEVTGHPVACAMNCGNLKPVAEAMRRRYAEARLIIAADDDQHTEGNPGLTKAREAATAVSGEVVTPGQSGDFNDLASDQGAAAVKARFEQTERPISRGFALVPASGLQWKEPDFLIDGLIERDALAVFFGPPETWKSLFAIDVLCSIQTGTKFHGRAVKTGRAVYICGEGFNGIARRLEAWNRRHGISKADNGLLISTQAAALNDETLFATVLAQIEQHQPDVIAIDTLARNFGPGDENATSDMQRFIRACDLIRQQNGCAVVLVHHSGVLDKTRARGNSALKGAADWEYQFERIADTVEVRCTKSKDAERPDPLTFALDVIDLAPGVTSVTLKTAEPAVAPPTTRKGKHQVKALAILESLQDLHRENLADSGHDPASAKVTLTDWRDACVADGMPRPRWYDAKRALHDANEIEIQSGGFVHLSGCPVPLRETVQNRTKQSGPNRTKTDRTGQQTGQQPDNSRT